MMDLFEAAGQHAGLLRRARLAVQRWGEPRITLDVDLTVLAGYGGERPFIDALPFEERIIERATLFSFRPGLDIRTRPRTSSS
jgi:hypothetical protein